MSGEKTEKATPKKLKDLRKKGSAARSVELPAGMSLLALVLVLPWMTHDLFDVLRSDMALVLSSVGDADVHQATGLASRMVVDCARAMAAPVAVVGAVALASGSIVTRSRPNPAVLKPQMDRVHPGKAIKRMLGPHSAVELLKSVVKLSALTAVTYGAWRDGYAALLHEGGSVATLQAVVSGATKTLLINAAVLAVVVGIADAAYQRHSFNKQAKMSKQDVTEEHKQADGNPETKSAIRSRQLAAARGRMIEAVPSADVVLANPTHLVVVLTYEPGQVAPVVVAKGAGATADRIKAVAAEHGVPVLQDKPLARALYQATEVGDTIPAEMFRVVAEVLATVYAAKRRGTTPTWSGRSAA